MIPPPEWAAAHQPASLILSSHGVNRIWRQASSDSPVCSRNSAPSTASVRSDRARSLTALARFFTFTTTPMVRSWPMHGSPRTALHAVAADVLVPCRSSPWYDGVNYEAEVPVGRSPHATYRRSVGRRK